jgi:TolB-like protein
MIGTPLYMSPEQAEMSVPDVDTRSDIWALGIVLYEMLTGQVPFRGDSEQAVIHSVLSEVPELPSSVNREVPSAVESAVLKCLSKDPAERFSSAADLRSLLASLRAGLPCADPAYSQPVARAAGAARRAGRPSQAPRWLGPSRSRLLLYALAAVCTLVGLSVLPPSGPILNLRAAALRLGISHLPAGKHVALLPLEVSGGDPETRALADGLVDVQTRKVAWIDGFTDSLWVAPVAEVISAGALDPRQARDVLGVNLTIGGSLTLVGDVVRVTLDLIDAASGARLKRNAVSDPLANLSTWQDSLSVIMMRMLEVPLPAARCADLSIGCATVPAAFRSYLVGRGYFHPFVGDPNLSAAAAWAARATGCE